MYGRVRSVRLRVVSGLRRDGQNWRRTQRRHSRRRAPEPTREPAERFRPIGTKAGALVAERQHGFTRPVTTACSIRGAPPQPTALLIPEACSANNGVICTPPSQSQCRLVMRVHAGRGRIALIASTGDGVFHRIRHLSILVSCTDTPCRTPPPSRDIPLPRSNPCWRSYVHCHPPLPTPPRAEGSTLWAVSCLLRLNQACHHNPPPPKQLSNIRVSTSTCRANPDALTSPDAQGQK